MKNKKSFSYSKVFRMVSKVFSWAIFVILILVAAFLMYYYIATKIYAAKGPGYEPKFSIYTIVSPSMTPNLRVYDAIINARIDSPDDIQVGDIITFISSSLQTTGTTITHRVVGITRDENGKVCYKTKGDFNPVADQSCAKFNNIIGKVILKIPQLGRIQFFLASKAGWLLCILIPALIIICRDVMRITKLAAIKENVNKMNQSKKKDPKKAQVEKKRKDELKRKLALENKEDKEYYKSPEIKEVVKKKNSIKDKKKGKS